MRATRAVLLTGLVQLAMQAPAGAQGFNAQFTAADSGNEWWVEVFVTASGALAGVDARVDGGDWHALVHEPWNWWASSFHVADGSVVEFRARASSGEEAISGGYHWPDGAPVPGGGNPPADFTATFLTPSGNNWWVETDVRANEPIAGVDARVNGGAWHALTLRQWGSWAASFSLPTGSVVDFRARTADGRESISQRYSWPDGTPVGNGNPGGTPMPDLVVSVPRLANSWYISREFIDPNSCTVVEECVGGSGWRNLLRFDSVFMNVGNADVVLGDPKTSNLFEYSPCHQHYHLLGSSTYTLLNQSRGVAAEGHKQSYCWSDNVRADGFNTPQHYPWTATSCTSNMGLSAGWGDLYEASLDCQFIDVTGVPSGDYVLSVTVNPQRLLPESNYTNNTGETTIRLP